MVKPLKPTVYLVGGLPRSGKTQIVERLLAEHGIPHIGTDTLRFVLQKKFTDEVFELEDGKRVEFVWPHLKSLILTTREFLHKTGFAIEGDLIKPERVVELNGVSDIKILFVGYADVSVDEKLKIVREYQHPHDWTDNMSDEELRKMVARQIEKSQIIRDQCKELGFKYIEMSGDFEKSLQEAIDFLVND